MSEDCLTLNIFRPSGAVLSNETLVPVMLWIYGGGFEIGGSSMYDGAAIVKRSITLKEPVVYVSMNYR